MSCKACRAQLSRYRDGALDPERREAVRAHLRGCAGCAAELDAYRRADAAIGGAFRVAPDPRFARAVLARTSKRTSLPAHRIEAPVAIEVLPRRRAGRRGQLLLGGFTGASTAALIVAALALGTNPGRSHAPAVGLVAQRAPVTIAQRAPVVAHTAIMPSGEHGPDHPSRRSRERSLASATITPGVARLDHAASLRLAPGPALPQADVRSPLWSPDSTSLLYLTGFSLDTRTDWYSGTLVRYGPSGAITLGTLVRNYVWSPDGTRIAYTTQTVDATDAGRLTQDLHLVAADGRGGRVLCRVDRASVEYLGGRILALQAGRPVRIDPLRGSSAPLGNLPAALRLTDDDNGFWALSANGRFFTSMDRLGLRIWDRDRDGALVLRQELTRRGEGELSRRGESGFHFSRDGNTIYYSTFDGHYTKLYRQTLKPPGAPQPLNLGLPLPGPILLVGSPSPDGALVSFQTGARDAARSYVIDAYRGRPRLLLPPGGVGPVGTLSPDGTRMIATTYQGDRATGSRIVAIGR